MRRALVCSLLCALGLLQLGPSLARAAGQPVRLALDLEIGDVSSTSDEAVRIGAEQAVAEINARGGVLGGRPLELVVTDNRSVPVRAVDNLRKHAADPDVVAVMTGKFSPVVLEQSRYLPELKMILLDPWAAADGIINNGQHPNWAFRLSLSDSMAVGAVLRQVKQRGFRQIGVLLPNIAWGRSNHDALRRLAAPAGVGLAAIEWYNWGGESSLVQRYIALRQAGAEAVFLVANEREGAQFLNEMAALPENQRLPIISHWGVTGGDFFKMAGTAIRQLDVAVVQTYSFGQATDARAKRLGQRAAEVMQVDHVERLPSPVGVAHAYDLTNLLAKAIDLAGSTDRERVRSALERLPAWQGVVKQYARPFTPERHEALVESDLFFSRYQADGRLVRSQSARPR